MPAVQQLSADDGREIGEEVKSSSWACMGDGR